jgi:uncharacterized protein (DUF736 family)
MPAPPLTLNGRVKILASDREASDGAPDFRISLGTTEIGAACRRTKQGTGQTYLRVRLDDPAYWRSLARTVAIVS